MGEQTCWKKSFHSEYSEDINHFSANLAEGLSTLFSAYLETRKEIMQRRRNGTELRLCLLVCGIGICLWKQKEKKPPFFTITVIIIVVITSIISLIHSLTSSFPLWLMSIPTCHEKLKVNKLRSTLHLFLCCFKCVIMALRTFVFYSTTQH